jgi:glycine/D-amino acid oxidase-like deaminating enzyme
MIRHPDVLIVGAGIFGVTAALETQTRGHRTALLDPGPLPHELAASTDISKVLRMEYGPDDAYMDWMAQAFDGWQRWNEAWIERGIGPLFHSSGVLMITRNPMQAGGFELESYRRLQARGLRPERLEAESIAERFPAWSTGRHVDGFFHAKGGWAESGRVVTTLVEEAQRQGVEIRQAAMTKLLVEKGKVVGVRDSEERLHSAGQVVLAAGAWTSVLLPQLSQSLTASGHPVFHLRPEDPCLFQADRFPVFTADISRTGFYGFPCHPSQDVVKIATHALGRVVDPRDPRDVTREDEERLRTFLGECLPDLADAPIVYRRLCLYSDTRDENFLIDRHPEIEGLIVAAGGSGHGFKFAPMLGPWIADVMDGRRDPLLARFRWRAKARAEGGSEAARCHDLE